MSERPHHHGTLRYDLDCPACKFGTLLKKKDLVTKTWVYRCIDCQRVFHVEQIEKGVIDSTVEAMKRKIT